MLAVVTQPILTIQSGLFAAILKDTSNILLLFSNVALQLAVPVLRYLVQLKVSDNEGDFQLKKSKAKQSNAEKKNTIDANNTHSLTLFAFVV